MDRKKGPRLLFAALCMVAIAAAGAEQKTVCTITVNSADEAQSFERRLPPAQYRFVELVEKGRADWLHSSCESGVRCDILLISGHFNAGDLFYSDRPGSDEYLSVDELERASCSESCPGIFSHLKEVYLFGCNSLSADASRHASSHGDSGLGRMRRIFSDVPVIYGFSASAPVGASAASRLERYFTAGPSDIGSGRVSARLLATFTGYGMVATRGVAGESGGRRAICPFFDERLAAAQKVAFVHGVLRSSAGWTGDSVERIERLMAAITGPERLDPAFIAGLARISGDVATRTRYLLAARANADAAVRWRMVSLAESLGWLTREARAAELDAMVRDILSRPALGLPEVELICALDAAGTLEGETATATGPVGRTAHAAALACLGDSEAHVQVLAALTSADERDVQVAQVYLRNRPVSDVAELRAMAKRISGMRGGAAQVRALDTFGRLSVADREITAELMGLFASATSLDVQKAIAEVLLRSDTNALDKPSLASGLRRHRLKQAGGDDLIEVLIRRLDAAA